MNSLPLQNLLPIEGETLKSTPMYNYVLQQVLSRKYKDDMRVHSKEPNLDRIRENRGIKLDGPIVMVKLKTSLLKSVYILYLYIYASFFLYAYSYV